MKCKQCGHENDNDSVFCQECGARLSEETQKENRFGNALNATGTKLNSAISNTIKTVRNGEALNTVVLAENETIIREYDATRVRYFFIKEYNGKLMITNKRIVFYAGYTEGNKTVLEMQINSVGPISSYLGRTFNLILLLVGALLLIISFVIFGENSYYFNTIGYGLLLLTIAVVIIILGCKKGMYLRIGAINAGPGITLGRGDTISSSQYCIDGKPGPDAYGMINELGAIVLDLQQLGDIAITKWKR